MSRHRDIRNLDYDEEYDHAHDDVIYGHSVEDSDSGVSPSTEQYLYSQRPDMNYEFGAYFPDEANIKEEDEDESDHCGKTNSNNFERSRLSSENEVRLNSVLDEIRNVVGDQFSDNELVKLVIENEYDLEVALNALLNLPSNSHNCQSFSNSAASNSDLTSTRVEQPGGTEKEFRTTAVTHSKVIEASLPSPKPSTKLRDKTVDIENKYKESRGQSKKLLNLVVVGHVDAGKSTLMGHLLYLQGIVAQRTMHKYEQESKKIGKQSFMYAWVLDDTEEERSRGITVDIAQRIFETKTKIVTLLDAPGHRDFIPNMILGAARADVAILVVDASKGAFEAGFESGGQTREHAILVRSLGVSEIIVAINKFDSVNWSQERFGEISSSLRQFLKTIGFRPQDIVFIPCSGLTGENLTQSPTTQLKSWYSGPSLLEAIDNLRVPDREIRKPVRFCISNIYKGQGSTICSVGRLNLGYLQQGDHLLLMPQSEIVSVKGILSDCEGESGYAFAGDHVTLNLAGVDPSTLHVGNFLCDPQCPIPLANRIQARIVVFNLTVPIIKGSQFDFYCQSVSETTRVRKLIALLHKSTGQVIKHRPRTLVKNSSAMIELEFERPLCLELYKDCKELGRFMLRSKGMTVAAGMVILIVN